MFMCPGLGFFNDRVAIINRFSIHPQLLTKHNTAPASNTFYRFQAKEYPDGRFAWTLLFLGDLCDKALIHLGS